MFFTQINPEIFSPLAGKSRKALYAETVIEVYKEFFSDESLGGHPRTEDIKNFIRDLHLRSPALLAADGSDSDEDVLAPNAVYVRLRDAGWLTEYRRGYRRLVDMPAEACSMASVMLSIRRGESRSFMGKLQLIASGIRSAYETPFKGGSLIIEAKNSVRDFLRHLRTLQSGMRLAEEAILRRRDALAVVRSFFDEFFEDYIKGACLPLLRDNNPYKYRDDILRDCYSLKITPNALLRLAESIVEHGDAKTKEEAHLIVVDALDFIDRAFAEVPAKLDEIKYYRSRMEARAMNAMIYLDRLRETQVGEIRAAVAAVAALPTSKDEVIDAVVDMSPNTEIVGPGYLAEPKMPRAKRTPVAIRKKVVDPALIGLKELRDAFDKKVQVSPHMLRSYLVNHVQVGQTVKADVFPITNFEEFYLFEAIRFINARYPILASEFEVSPLDGWRLDDWIGVRNFTVSRKEKSRASVR